MKAVFIFLLGLVSIIGQVSATNEVRITDNREVELIGSPVSYLKDSSNSLSITTAPTQFNTSNAQSSESLLLSFGLSNAAHWIKIHLNNTTQQSQYKELGLKTIWYDEFDVYFEQNGKLIKHWQAGVKRPFNEEVHLGNTPAFGLNIPAGKSDIYIRVKGIEPLLVPLTIRSQESQRKYDQLLPYYFGALYGALLIIAVYNLFLFSAVKDVSYLYYVIFLTSFILMTTGYNGFQYRLFWYDNPYWATWQHVFQVSLYPIAGSLFAMSFLSTKKTLPKSHKVLQAFLAVIIASLSASFIFQTPHIGMFNSIVANIFYPLIVISIAMKSWQRGRVDVQLFIFASIATLIGSLFTALTVLGALPYTFYYFHAPEFGFILDAVLLSFALANKINMVRDEKEEELEIKVQERTQELHNATLLAEQATEAKSNFLANMSHEIRTPMNAVIGLSRLMNRTKLTPDQKGNLNKILGASESLLSLINDILDFSKIEANKLTLEKSNFELATSIQRVVDVCSHKIHEKNLELVVDIPASVPQSFNGDALRLEQVLINLTNNAVKFTPSGSICIKAEIISQTELGCELQFSVIDTGIGMSPTQQSKLFRSFSQADDSITRKYGGTGLGLVISKQLCELMSGRIWCESEQGKGSSFNFTVKLALQTTNGVQSQQSKYSAGKSLSALKVLIADDIEVSRKVLLDALTSVNIAADCVEDGKQAVSKVVDASKSGQPYDLILMDWKMPNLDGIGASRLIKQQLTKEELPHILMVSAYDKDEAKVEAFETGIQFFLEKPVNPSQLINTISTVISGAVQSEHMRSEGSFVETRFSDKAAPDLSQYHVLLVEDNLVNQQVAKGFLADTQIKIDTAVNGLIALDKLKSNVYDLVLMDIQMPEMDGLTAAKKVRNELNLDLPIIAMTAHAMSGDEDKSIQAGMNAHLTKPIEPVVLFNTLAEYLPTDNHIDVQSHQTVELGTGSEELNADSAELSTESLEFGTESTEYSTESTAINASLESVITEKTQVVEPELLIALRQSNEFDVDSAISKVQGKQALFLELIHDFHKSNTNTVELLTTEATQSNWNVVYRIIHSLKSSAAYIGLARLSNISQQLEDMLNAAETYVEYEYSLQVKVEAYPLIEELKSLLSSVMSLLEQAIEAQSQSEQITDVNGEESNVIKLNETTVSQAVVLCSQLSPLLESCSFDAESVVSELATTLEQSHLSKQVNEIRQLVSDFEFDAASIQLNGVVELLGQESL